MQNYTTNQRFKAWRIKDDNDFDEFLRASDIPEEADIEIRNENIRIRWAWDKLTFAFGDWLVHNGVGKYVPYTDEKFKTLFDPCD